MPAEGFADWINFDAYRIAASINVVPGDGDNIFNRTFVNKFGLKSSAASDPCPHIEA